MAAFCDAAVADSCCAVCVSARKLSSSLEGMSTSAVEVIAAVIIGYLRLQREDKLAELNDGALEVLTCLLKILYLPCLFM